MTNQTELPWIELAKSLIGTKEIPGGKHAHAIQSMLGDMGSFNGESRAWWSDDETPWCGLFTGWILGKSGRFVVKHWYRAHAWSDGQAMTPLIAPAYGSIAVFSRAGGGHVGPVVGQDEHGRLMILGGNQGNQVSIAPFSAERLVGCYWPSRRGSFNTPMLSRPHDDRYVLPLIKSGNAKSSDNEA